MIVRQVANRNRISRALSELEKFSLLSHTSITRPLPLSILLTILNPMDALLVDAIAALAEQMKSLPDAGMAEEQDFEGWGKEFCVRLVSVFIQSR